MRAYLSSATAVARSMAESSATGEHLDYDNLRADTVRQVAKLMAAAAITAPKSGGQLFLAGKHLFIETVTSTTATPLRDSPPGCAPAARNAAKHPANPHC